MEVRALISRIWGCLNHCLTSVALVITDGNRGTYHFIWVFKVTVENYIERNKRDTKKSPLCFLRTKKTDFNISAWTELTTKKIIGFLLMKGGD